MADNNFWFLSDENEQLFPSCNNFRERLEGAEEAVVLFMRGACDPCVEYLMGIAELGDQPGVSFAAVDLDQCGELGAEFQVDMTPTITINSRGHETFRLPITGQVSEDIEKLSKILVQRRTDRG